MIVKMIQVLKKIMEAQTEKIQEMFNRDLQELKVSLVAQTVKNQSANKGYPGSISGSGTYPGEGNGWLPTPVFLPGEFNGHRSLAGYSSGVTENQTRVSN